MDDKAYLLSDSDLMKIFNNKLKIIKYSDVKYYNDLSELLAPYGRTVILIETSPNRGHWTCIFEGTGKEKYNIFKGQKKKNIFYFDSYGVIPDGQLKRIDYNIRLMLGEGSKDLVPLFHNYMIKYNVHRLQEKKKGIATCGKWCAARMILNNLNSDEFAELFLNKEIKPDDIITKVMYYFLNK